MGVIGLSVNGGDADNQRAMRRAGAQLLLTKDAAAEVLYEAILQTSAFPNPSVNADLVSLSEAAETNSLIIPPRAPGLSLNVKIMRASRIFPCASW